MLISVIIPVYNVEKYIRKCLESIMNQTYKNIEIILVNDGSTDNSGSICDDWACKDSRIKVIHKQNGGLSSARNEGLKSANGDFVTFIDSDDWVVTSYLEEMLLCQQKYDADIVQCNRWFEDERCKKTEKVYVWNNIDAVNALWGEYYIPTVNSTCKLIRRMLFDNLRFTEGMIHEDEMIAHRLLYSINKMAFMDKAMYCVVRNPQSITRTAYSLKNLDILKAYEDRLSFFRELKEDKIYARAFYLYIIEISRHIRKVKENIESEKEVIKQLKQKYRKTFAKAMLSPKLSLRNKTSLFLRLCKLL